ncbi:MAG: hypothetical protein ACYSWP_00185 [Planctomycetota bacterium]|jgi:tetratricopeptide (TPR) repeat protein
MTFTIKTIVISVLLVVICPVAIVAGPAEEAQGLFNERQYGKGFSLLNRALRDKRLSQLQRAQALETYARFYEDFMGSPDGALRRYKSVLKTKLPGNHPLKENAREQINRLEALKRKYAKQDAVIKKVRSISSRRPSDSQIENQIRMLQGIIDDHPQYYRLVEVYHYLGLHYMALEENGKAYKHFQQCLELKSYIDAYLPVSARARIAYARSIADVTGQTAWTILGILLLVCAASFYLCRPWRGVNGRLIVIALVLAGLFVGVYCLTWFMIARSFEPEFDIIKQIGVSFPFFASATFSAPGSAVVRYLLFYGLTGIAAIFVFSTATSRLKGKFKSVLLNAVFGLLLFCSLAVVFFLRHCYDKSTFKSHSEGLMQYPNSKLYFIVDEPERYILTNPKAYPNLNIRNMKDAHLKSWIQKHCPFDKPKPAERPRPGRFPS